MTFDYDPNLATSPKTNLVIRLVFGCWTYRLVEEVRIGGNVPGFGAIDAAISHVYDRLCDALEDGDLVELRMTDDNGDDLLCRDEEQDHEEWLKDMLVSAEIVGIEPRPDVQTSGRRTIRCG